MDVDCKSSFFTDLGGLPEQRRNVEVRSEFGDILWTGWVAKPIIKVARGVFQGFHLEADGYQYAGMTEPFEVHQVYGPASLGDTSTAKLVTSNILEAMDHARAQLAGAITNTRFPMDSINFEEDTDSFFRRTAVDVWNTCNNELGYIGNPLFWQVYSIDNVVTLEFLPHSGGPDYFEQGRAKDMALEFDANEVIWRCAVDFGGEQLYAATVPPTIATSTTQSKVVSLETEIRRMTQARQVAESIVAKLSPVRITGGHITIDQPINTAGCSNMPPSWLRSGRVIIVSIPVDAEPYNTYDTGGGIDGLMYIRSCAFDEDSCTTTLSASPYTDNAKAARVLPFQSTPGLTWGAEFGIFNPPPKMDKIPFVGSTPDPNRNPDLTPIIGSMIPTGYRTDGQHDFGPTGAVFDPKEVPKEVVTANYWITGLITAAGPPPVYATIPIEQNAVIQAVPEMVVERIELLGDVIGSITLRFDKFIQATQTTTANYLAPVTLSSQRFSQTVILSSDPALGDPDNRKQFRTGDFIIIHVDVAAVNLTKLAIAIFGRKIWESFMPPTQGPNWVKRPASPSYPQSAGWA